MAKEKVVTTEYYETEGDALRIHRDEDGDLTADIYRGGKGHVRTDVSLMESSVPISESQYNEMVREEDERFERKKRFVS